MENLEPASEVLARWIAGNASFADERDLYDSGEISRCEFEFGPHEDHAPCDEMLAGMTFVHQVHEHYNNGVKEYY